MILFVSPTQINLLPTIFYFKAFSTTTSKKEDYIFFLIFKRETVLIMQHKIWKKYV